MKKRTSPLVFDDWFKLDVPADWRFEEHDGLISLHGAAGSMHISLFDRGAKDAPSPAEATSLALQFARGQGWRVDETSLSRSVIDGAPAVAFELVDDEQPRNHWHVWHVVEQTRVVLITWVCPSKQAEVERAERAHVVESLEWD